MRIRRLLYLGCLAGSLVFYFCYQQWLSWMVLLAVVFLPWVSLLVSLPAMLQFRAELEAPSFVEQGGHGDAALWGLSHLPQPLFQGKLVLENCNTGEKRRHHPLTPLPTDHCGGWKIIPQKVRVYDYLGLFRIRVKHVHPHTVVVRPRPLAMSKSPALSRAMSHAWRPKFGGGYAENHELRLYRPGDSLNQIHWKLSAKTGDWILREPMVPNLGRTLLTLDLSGTPEELDRKLGRLLWLSRDLLEQGLPHEICCLTGDGAFTYPISCGEDVTTTLDEILCCPLSTSGTLASQTTQAAWQFHIGGEPDEA